MLIDVVSNSLICHFLEKMLPKDQLNINIMYALGTAFVGAREWSLLIIQLVFQNTHYTYFAEGVAAA